MCRAVLRLSAGEAGGEVAAAEEGFDGDGGGGVERAEGFAVKFFVAGDDWRACYVIYDLETRMLRFRRVEYGFSVAPASSPV